MEIPPVTSTTTLIQFAAFVVAIAIFALHKWWAREREISRSLRERSEDRSRLVDVEGPMTKAATELAALQDRTPGFLSEGEPRESSLAEEAKSAGA
jgi:hypothetical protein